MFLSDKVGEYQPCRFSAETLNLVFPNFGTLRCVLQDHLQLIRWKACIVFKRKEPMDPSVLWLFFQFLYDFLRCLILPFRKMTRTVDIFFIHRQSRIIRVQCCHQIITSHGCFSDKIYVCGIYFIYVQTAILSTQGLLPLFLVTVAQHINYFIPLASMQNQMRNLIVFGSAAVILHQDPEIIQYTKVLVDDVLLSSSGVIRCNDMQLLGAFRHLKHKLEDSYRCFTCRRGSFQEFHRSITFQECFVFL